MSECTVCGAGFVRDHHAAWCAHVTRWLRSLPTPSEVANEASRAKAAERKRAWRARKKAAAA